MPKFTEEQENAARSARQASFDAEERLLHRLPRLAQSVRNAHQTLPCDQSVAVAKDWTTTIEAIATLLAEFTAKNGEALRL